MGTAMPWHWSKVQLIVGTPGRTLDLINRKKLVVDQLRRVVLDEADEMLNMGLRADPTTIYSEWI